MTNTSRDTVVGIFDDQQSAQAVVDDLINNGFSRDQVHLESQANYGGEIASGGAGLTGRTPSEHHGGFMGWLKSLFGGDEYSEDTTRYGEAVRRGSYVVVVNTEANQSDRAVEILNEHGAIDVDQHAVKYGYGTSAGTEAISDQEARPIPAQRGGVRVYSRAESGTGSGYETRTGYQSGTSSYDDDFRQDFQTRYGSSGAVYESYAPAYDYGYRMASDSRYKDRSWSDVESTLETDYLRNNPNSTWDQVKGAVRYGWEKVTGKR